jgi:hypothetical protein
MTAKEKGEPLLAPTNPQPPTRSYMDTISEVEGTRTPQPDPLSKEDRRMLEVESGISPEVIEARGYYTAAKRTDVPDVFPEWQRRLGLVIPTHSPDGETVGYQLRPNKRRAKGPKYETPHGARITVDVNPLMLEEVRSGDSELWATEGMRKVDSLTSRGLPTAGFTGVWNFATPGTKCAEPLPCWQHIRLRGRTVIVVYDADARTNADVQEALRRLVAMLEGLGAVVLVVYLPPVNGDGKAGVDDYLAAGGTLEELRSMAQPYKPVDVAGERLSRNEELQAKVEDLERTFWAHEYKGRGGHSLRDVFKELIEAAAEKGRLHRDGVRVQMAHRTLARRAKISTRTLGKVIDRMEEEGLGYRDNGGRKADKAGAFVLRAKVRQYGEGHTSPRESGDGERGSVRGVLPLRAPRLRWSSPAFKGRRGVVKGTRRVRLSLAPRPRPAVKRLGKIRGAVLDVLDAAGGSASVVEICEVLQRSRPRDLRRRVLPMLEEARIITVEDGMVTLVADWLERLEEARELGGEIEAERRERANHRRVSEAFRRRGRTDADHHFANDPGADGHAGELRPVDEPADAAEAESLVSPLAAAVRDYLDIHPSDACQPPGWIGSTFWAYELYPGKPTAAEIRAAIEELGGEAYLRERLEAAKGVAA